MRRVEARTRIAGSVLHACVPGTLKVLYFGYGDTRDDLSRLFDYSVDPGTVAAPGNQPFDVTQPTNNRQLANIWSAEHDFLDDAAGTVLVHGGFTPRETYQFDPGTRLWTRKRSTAHDRFYSTTLMLADRKLITLFGAEVKSFEIYDPAAGTWAAPVEAPVPDMEHQHWYPWTLDVPPARRQAIHRWPARAYATIQRGSGRDHRARVVSDQRRQSQQHRREGHVRAIAAAAAQLRSTGADRRWRPRARAADCGADRSFRGRAGVDQSLESEPRSPATGQYRAAP